MTIQTTFRHMDSSDSLRDYAEEKLQTCIARHSQPDTKLDLAVDFVCSRVSIRIQSTKQDKFYSVKNECPFEK